MNGLLVTFFLKDFNTFFDNYKLENNLANEVLIVLEYFLLVLNEFFDLCKGLTDAMNCKIS